MPYAYWLAAITSQAHHEHQKILNQSVSIFSAAVFVRLLGKQRFIDTWREVREDVDTQCNSTRQGRVILDGLWSVMMTGFAFSQHAFKLQKPISKQLKTTYVDICSRSTKSIDQVALDINRPCSRVYADIKRLQKVGLVKASSTVRAGKRVTLLSAA